MPKAVVPVVIKLLAESDPSIEGAVASVRDSLKQASKNTLDQLGANAVTVAKDTAAKVSKALSDARVEVISGKAISLAKTGLQEVQQSGSNLLKSLDGIEKKFKSIPAAATDVRTSKPYDELIKKAGELQSKNLALTQALVDQRKAAEDLKKAKPEDRQFEKNILDNAKVVTSELRKEAAIIQAAYNKAFEEVSKGLSSLKKESDKAASEAKKTTTAKDTPKLSGVQSTELEIIRQRFKISQDIASNAEKLNQITRDRLALEQRISQVSSQTEKSKLNQSLLSLQPLRTTFEQTSAAAVASRKQAQKDTEALLEAQRNKSPNIQVLKQLALQSKLTADALSADAKKAEQAYSQAFVKIKSEADKALNAKAVSSPGSRLASGLGIFSPIVNQLGSAIDQVIGRIGPFGVTAGVQIGQAISQGIGQGLSQGAKTSSEKVNTLIEDFKRLDDAGKQVVAGFATAFVVGSAAAAAALAGLSALTVKVASDFEVLTAKLTTTFKSPTVAVERFQLALELAAKTPYNVEQVVAAQVQLSALGQKNIEVLKATIDLASGLNADLARTANEVGKAAAGSLRGYQELRNTLGITQERLKQFGGVVDSQNRLLVRNEYQIKKNREALLLLIKTDFGGSAERLSATLQGRISNLQDEILKLGGALGSGLLPQIKSGVETLSGFFKILNDLPPVAKTLTSGLITTGAALFTFAAGISATSLALGILGPALSTSLTPAVLAFAANIPLATGALTALNFVVNTTVTGLLTKLLPAVVTTSRAFVAFDAATKGITLASLAGPLSALVVAAGALNAVINAQAQAFEETAAKAKAYTDEIVNAKRANKSLQEDIVTVFELPPDFLAGLNTTEEKVKKIQDELDRKGAFRLAQDLGLAGRTTEQLLEEFTKLSGNLDVQEKRLKGIADLRKQIAQSLSTGNQIDILSQLQTAVDNGIIPQITDEVKDLIDVDPTKAVAVFDTYAQKLEKLANINISNLKPRVELLRALTNALDKIESVFDKTQKAITRAEGPAKFALKIGDITLLNSALKQQIELQKQITEQIEKTEGLREKSRKGTRFSLEEAVSLKEGAIGPNKDLLEKFISTNDLITDLTNARVKAQSKADALSLQQLEAREKRELAVLGKGSKERQLKIVEESIAVVKARADGYQKELDEFVRLQGLLKSKLGPGLKFDIQNKLDRSTERIEAGKKAFDLLIDLEKKRASIVEAIEAESLKKSKKNIQDKYEATKNALQDLVADTKQIASGVRPTELTQSVKSFVAVDGKTILQAKKPIEEFSDAALTASEKIEIFQNKLFELRNKRAQTKFETFGDKADELKNAFRDAERTLEEGLDKAKLQRGRERIKSERVDEQGKKRVVRENFADFKTNTNKELAETIGKQGQLEVIQKALATLAKEEANGNIRSKEARAENARLTKIQRDLQLDLNKAVADQVRELEQVRAERIKDEIEILKISKEGKTKAQQDSIDLQIKGRNRQLVQEQFLELKAQRDLELEEAKKNGKSQELILEKYAQKQNEILRKSYLEHVKNEQDKLKATTDRFKAEEDALKSFREKRLGGRNSPLISIEELSYQSTLPGFGSDAESRLARQQDRFATPFASDRFKIPSFESYKTKFEQENNLKLGKDGKPLPSAFDNISPINTGGGTQITNIVNIDSRSVGDADIVKAGADLAMSAMKTAQKNNSLISGNKGGSIAAKPFGAKPFGAKQIGSDAGFGFTL